MFMLRPVLRLCLRHSLKLNDLIEIVKIVYVQVAKEDLQKRSEDVSVSRLSVMTGVHRKDVTRIYRNNDFRTRAESLVSKILGAWQQNPHFLTKSGKPRTISVEGSNSEFTQLVRSVSADLNPYTVLYEMERAGLVKRTARGLNMVSGSHISSENLEEGVMLLAEDLNDLVSGVEENVFERKEVPNLHLKTEYDKIDPRALPKIREWLIEQGEVFHRKARKFLAEFDGDLNPKRATDGEVARVVIGSFSRIEEDFKS